MLQPTTQSDESIPANTPAVLLAIIPLSDLAELIYPLLILRSRSLISFFLKPCQWCCRCSWPSVAWSSPYLVELWRALPRKPRIILPYTGVGIAHGNEKELRILKLML